MKKNEKKNIYISPFDRINFVPDQIGVCICVYVTKRRQQLPFEQVAGY